MRLRGEDRVPSCCPISLGRVCDGVDQVRLAAREELRRGAHHIKIMASGGVSSPTDFLTNLQVLETLSFHPNVLNVTKRSYHLLCVNVSLRLTMCSGAVLRRRNISHSRGSSSCGQICVCSCVHCTCDQALPRVGRPLHWTRQCIFHFTPNSFSLVPTCRHVSLILSIGFAFAGCAGLTAYRPGVHRSYEAEEFLSGAHLSDLRLYKAHWWGIWNASGSSWKGQPLQLSIILLIDQ